MITRKNKRQVVWLLMAIFSLPLFFKPLHHCCIEHNSCCIENDAGCNDSGDAERHEDCPICLFSFFNFIDIKFEKNDSYQILLQLTTTQEEFCFFSNKTLTKQLRAPPVLYFT